MDRREGPLPNPQAGLVGIHAAQESYYAANNGEYAENFDDLDFSMPDAKGTYCFYLSETEALPGGCNNYTIIDEYEAWVYGDEFVALAIGDVDSDQTLDIWAIDDTGELYQIQDDLHN